MDYKAKKSLGQNFLKSKLIAKKIVSAGKLQKGDTVLEIGPGKGMLTEYLLETGEKVVAVEKDDLLIGLLSERFAKELKSGQFGLIHKDILEFDPTIYNLQHNNYSIIANIPYYITGALFKKFLESDYQPKSMVLLVQKEVAQRIVGHNPTSPRLRGARESILSISVKAYGTPKIALKVQSRFFSPQPKVDSAVLTIENISKTLFTDTLTGAKHLGISEKWFFEVVKAGFAHKRKVLIKNLEKVAKKEQLKEIFQQLGISEKSRPENIHTDQWISLSKLLAR